MVFFVFAVIFYYIAITGYANSIETKIAFHPNLLTYRPALLLNYHPSHTNESPLTKEEVEIDIDTTPVTINNETADIKEWKEKLLQLMQSGKAYEDPELSLAQVAKQLQSNPSFISRMVNTGFGVNFNDFVNQFRIEAVKEMLNNGEHKNKHCWGSLLIAGLTLKPRLTGLLKSDRLKPKGMDRKE